MVNGFICDCIDLDKNDFNYNSLIEYIIRDSYSVSDELAILRQKDSKQHEFEEYNSVAESAKAIAKYIFNVD